MIVIAGCSTAGSGDPQGSASPPATSDPTAPVAGTTAATSDPTTPQSGETAGGTAGATASAAAAKPGGTLTFAGSANPACLDPHQLSENLALTVGRQITDSLTVQDPATGEIKPWIAQSWTVTDDAKAFTFKLRSGVTFSDGSALDATAVKDNLDDIVALGAKSLLGSTYLANYQQSKIIDPTTIEVDFSQPSAQFLQATATITLGLLSPANLKVSAADRCTGKLVGSGPFVLDSFSPNNEIVLGKRSGYDWGPSSAEHTGDAYLDKIDIKIIPEAGVRTGSLQSHQVQGIQDLQPTDQSLFDGRGFFLLVRSNPGIVTSLIPNQDRPATSDPQVRAALQKGVNRQEIIDTLFTPKYKPATSILASTTPGYTDLSSDLAFDPDGAKKLLDDDGWATGADGIRTKNGQRLTLRLLGADSSAELVQQQLKAIGVDLQIIQISSSAQYLQIQGSGDYDLATYNLTRADPDVLKAIFSTKFTNVGHLKPGDLDTQLDLVSSTSDPAQRTTAAATVQQTIVQDSDAIPLTEQVQVYGFSDQVQGISFEASSRLSFYDAWLNS